MEIEIRGRKMILPVETVFDLDRNAAVWTFVFPERIAGRETEKLVGWLAVKTNAEEKTVRVAAYREGSRFSVTLPAGLFQGATVAEVQFSLSNADFTWHTEIETVNVVRCLDPLGEVTPYQPNEFALLENAVRETQEKVEGLLSGNTPAGSAEKDGEGNVIALTYATKESLSALSERVESECATKEELNSLSETSERVYAKKEDVSRSMEQMEQTFVTKGDFMGAQVGNQQMFATKMELGAAQSEHENFATKEAMENLQNEMMRSFATKSDLSGTAAGFAQTYATKGEVNALQNEHANFATKGDLLGEISAVSGGATELTDLKKVEEVLLNEESGNAALYEKQRVLDENSTWFLLDYAAFCAESEILGVHAVNLFHNKLKEIKAKFQGVNRPNVMVYTSNNKNPFFGTSAFNFVSGVNYYYYTYSTSEVTASVKIKDCSNINLHGFVMTGRDHLDSALQLINCANIRVERCSLTSTGKGAVTVDRGRDIVIEDCALYGAGYQGTSEVTVRDSTANETTVTFRHCRFKNNGNGAINASEVTNPNLSIVLDHVYYTDGSKITQADCVSGSAKLHITALEEDLPTLATEEKDGLISKEQSAFLSAFQQGQGRHRYAFGELGMYEEYPVNVQVEYVRTGLKCGLLNLVYRMPEIPETESRFGHISIEKLNALMRSRFGFDFSISNRITGVWFASEKENLLQAGCGVGVYSNYMEPVTVTTEGKNVGLSLKQTGGALFRLLNVFVNER